MNAALLFDAKDRQRDADDVQSLMKRLKLPLGLSNRLAP